MYALMKVWMSLKTSLNFKISVLPMPADMLSVNTAMKSSGCGERSDKLDTFTQVPYKWTFHCLRLRSSEFRAYTTHLIREGNYVQDDGVVDEVAHLKAEVMSRQHVERPETVQ